MTVQIWFGGSFDPVHQGHLQIAAAVSLVLQPDKLWFLPTYNNQNKQPSSGCHRIAMLRCALQETGNSVFDIDLREVNSQQTSYTFHTLQTLQSTRPVLFMLGADAWTSIHSWLYVEKLHTLCNLLVVCRAQYAPQNQDLHNFQRVQQPTALLNGKIGQILFFNAGHYASNSSTIRSMSNNGQWQQLDNLHWLHPTVLHYIQHNRVYG